MRKMSLLLLQASMPLASRTLPKRLPLASPLALIHLHTKTTTTIAFSSKNSPVSSSSSMSHFTHSLTLPIQPHLPVQITAAPGVSDSEFRIAIGSSLFNKWLNNLQSETGILANGTMLLHRVLIQGVDMFGRRVGFLKFKADIIDKETGNKVPGIVFARGPAVAVLILLQSEGETFAVLTEQARVPTGKVVLELPAGMLDDENNDIVGTAVREVEEETGINLKLQDMIDLTAFLDASTGHRVFPSPGGCDEEISLFLYRGHVDREIITQLQGKETGLRDHGELINVRVVPYEKLWRMTADAKVLMAVSLYEMAKKDGLLPHSEC
ncbi:nudix hydrolase 14, chloroplastic [Tripterygium wilfordii]|uniref:nudix hydrolase 14, chloroplastic n=1 Tax=Tripterygium wilfordii TaxID=458696 RepID=UPI0018F83625|nr:nudix hydrolase 14, chloroplastic [Tripterygium wilfordii]